MPSIDQFTALIRDVDVARPNLFNVFISPPKILRNTGGVASRMIPLLATKFNSPMMGVSTNGPTLASPAAQMPYMFNFEDLTLTLTFLVDADYKSRKFFDAWVTEIGGNIDKKFEIPYLEDLICEEMSVHFNGSSKHHNDNVFGYKFYEVFPTSVATMNYSMDEARSPVDFAVTFKATAFEAVTFINGEAPTSIAKSRQSADDASRNQ